MVAKVMKLEKLRLERQQLGRAKKQVVFTNGCFDILHRGHAEYLAKAREYGDILIVGLNSDHSVTRLKGAGRPIVPAEDRAYLLAALAAVDYVVIFDEDTPERIIEALQPDVLVKGGDYRIQDIVGREAVEANGGRVLTLPFVSNRSTTNIIDKITALTTQGFLASQEEN